MANSLMQIVSDGSLSTIPLTIQFFEQSHIKVFVDNTQLPSAPYTFVWSGVNTITITPPVALGAEVSIRRKTPDNEMFHDFQSGAVFNPVSIDENFKQELFILQEATEQSFVTDLFEDLDMHGNSVRNLRGATLPKDAVNLQQAEALASSGGTSVLRQELASASGGTLVNTPKGTVTSRLDTLDATTVKRNPVYTLGDITSRMAAGEIVHGCVVGDSTVDGFGTTSWVANPTSGGGAVGNTDHNLEAVNSWPVKLEGLLRDIYSNPTIYVHNAGYSGKALADGWALANYDAAVTNNPFYGTPDFVFIDFGLNDVRPIGSQVQDFKDQLVLLIDKIKGYGTLPIVVTCDPIMRNYNVVNAIYNREVLLQIDEVKREVAVSCNVPLVEKGEMLREWANNNTEGYRWFLEQSRDVNGDGIYSSGDDVGLHFHDNGHAVKAQIAAVALCAGVVHFNGTPQNVTANDARTSAFGNFLLTLNGTADTHSLQGFSYRVDYHDANMSHRPSGPGAPMLTMWVWNTAPECNLVYRGILGEGWGTVAPDYPIADPAPPKVRVTTATTGAAEAFIPAAVGFPFSGFYKPSDVPYSIKRLPYGLSKVEYLCGDFNHYAPGSGASIFPYGFFELQGTTHVNFTPVRRFTAAEGVLDTSGSSATYGVTGTQCLSIYLDVELPIGCGVSLLSTSSFFGLSSTVADGYGSRQATVLYRQDATRVRLANVKRGALTGGMLLAPLAVSVTAPFSGNRLQLRVDIQREFASGNFGGGNQLIELHAGFGSTSPLQSISRATSEIPALFGGVLGGFYSDATLNVAGGTVIIHSLYATITE